MVTHLSHAMTRLDQLLRVALYAHQWVYDDPHPRSMDDAGK